MRRLKTGMKGVAVTTILSTIAGSETEVPDEALEELRMLIRGNVLTPEDEAYERVRAPYNAMQIDVFALLTEARQRIAVTAAGVEAERDFWLADTNLGAAMRNMFTLCKRRGLMVIVSDFLDPNIDDFFQCLRLFRHRREVGWQTHHQRTDHDTVDLGDVEAVSLRPVPGLRLAAWGTAFGAVGALGITRVIGSLLYNVTPTDPVSFGGVMALMLAVAAAAAYLPARRATLVDPMVALRAE